MDKLLDFLDHLVRFGIMVAAILAAWQSRRANVTARKCLRSLKTNAQDSADAVMKSLNGVAEGIAAEQARKNGQPPAAE